MSLEELINSLTYEDLQKINEEFQKKELKTPIFLYSKMTMEILNSIVNIEKEYNKHRLDEWFNFEIKIDKESEIFLLELLERNEFLLKSYNEEELKMKFLSLILNRVNFQTIQKRVRDFYEAKLTYKSENFILTGTTDYLVSKGLEYVQKPYFFIQEFKKSIENSDPEPQLLAELISAVELNNAHFMRGAYIIGENWYFVILDRVTKHNYKYYVSSSFNATKIEDLKAIYKNLLYVKNEIMELEAK